MKRAFLTLAMVFIMAGIASANTVFLDWEFPQDQISNITGYNIYMRVEGSDWENDAILVAPSDEFHGEIAGLPDGQYWFCISADYGIYESPRSAEGGIIFNNGEVSFPLSMSVPTILTIQGQAN